jgi:WD40 repeat protein
MSDMKPLGVDQTTGQQRSVESGDSVVDNIGDQIEIVVTQVYDYSGNLRNNVQVLFPWGSPEKLPDPATLPAANQIQLDWSPNGEFLVGCNTAPLGAFLNAWQRVGNTFTKLPNSAFSVLPGNNTNDVAWSYDGGFLAVASKASPYLFIYQRNGSSFTKVADPASLPDGQASKVSWTPNGEFLSVAYIQGGTGPTVGRIYQRSGTTFTKIADPATLGIPFEWSPNNEFLASILTTSPYFIVNQRNGTTLTKIADPTTVPISTVNDLEWSPDGQFLALAKQSSPFIAFYQRNGNTLAKLADPSTAANAAARITWSPNGEFVLITGSGSPGFDFFQRNGNTFTRIDDAPATLPTSVGQAKWSPDGQFIAVGGGTPTLTFYRTGRTMPDSGIVKIHGVIREGD